MPKFVFKKMFKTGMFHSTVERPLRWDDQQLDDLADAMMQIEPMDSTIPAGYTYLGQFIDHDISLDSRSNRRKPADRPWGVEITPDNIENLRVPYFDLETIYGVKKPRNDGEPSRTALLEDNSNTLLKLGKTVRDISDADPNVRKSFSNDLPRDGKASSTAVIVDQRNDENLAVAQIQVAFIKFHNAVVRALGGNDSTPLFKQARETVIRHYQHIVLYDFLPKIVDNDILRTVRAEVDSGNHSFDLLNSADLFMPLEFAVAAFRMGHSSIRNTYNWNRKFRSRNTLPSAVSLEALARLTGAGKMLKKMPGEAMLMNENRRTPRHLPTIWVINWNWFFNINDSKTREASDFNFAKKFDTKMSSSLGLFHPKIEDFDNTVAPELLKKTNKRVNSLPALDLFRGRILGIPTGQEVAKVVREKTNLKVIEPQELESLLETLFQNNKNLADDRKILLKEAFKDETPLWFYLLAEAELQKDGEMLGNVGSWIVAETFLKLLKASPYSILNKQLQPGECVFPSEVGAFGMSEMLQFIAKQNPEDFDELNPLG